MAKKKEDQTKGIQVMGEKILLLQTETFKGTTLIDINIAASSSKKEIVGVGDLVDAKRFPVGKRVLLNAYNMAANVGPSVQVSEDEVTKETTHHALLLVDVSDIAALLPATFVEHAAPPKLPQ